MINHTLIKTNIQYHIPQKNPPTADKKKVLSLSKSNQQEIFSIIGFAIKSFLKNQKAVIFIPCLYQTWKNIQSIKHFAYTKEHKKMLNTFFSLFTNVFFLCANNRNIKIMLCIQCAFKALSELKSTYHSFKQREKQHVALGLIKTSLYAYFSYISIEEEFIYLKTKLHTNIPKEELASSNGTLKIFMKPGHSFSLLTYKAINGTKINKEISFEPAYMYQDQENLENRTFRISELLTSTLGKFSIKDTKNENPAHPHATFSLNTNQIEKLLLHLHTTRELSQNKRAMYNVFSSNCITTSQDLYLASELKGDFFTNGFKERDIPLFVVDKYCNVELSYTALYAYLKYKPWGLVSAFLHPQHRDSI